MDALLKDLPVVPDAQQPPDGPDRLAVHVEAGQVVEDLPHDPPELAGELGLLALRVLHDVVGEVQEGELPAGLGPHEAPEPDLDDDLEKIRFIDLSFAQTNYLMNLCEVSAIIYIFF